MSSRQYYMGLDLITHNFFHFLFLIYHHLLSLHRSTQVHNEQKEITQHTKGIGYYNQINNPTVQQRRPSFSDHGEKISS
jgi:hypothetical protein